MPRIVLLLTLACFGALSAAALRDHGFWGILAPHFQTFGGAQVFADLVIALTLAMVWIVRDARASHRNPWPWVALTLATGSFGPLLYLLAREMAPRRSTAAVAR
jgi:Terpene cyclase DEP1